MVKIDSKQDAEEELMIDSNRTSPMEEEDQIRLYEPGETSEEYSECESDHSTSQPVAPRQLTRVRKQKSFIPYLL